MWFTCNCSIIVSKLTHARLRSLFISSVMCRKISHIINLHAMMLTTFVGSRSSKVSICKSLPPGTAFRSYNSTVSAWFSVCYLILIFLSLQLSDVYVPSQNLKPLLLPTIATCIIIIIITRIILIKEQKICNQNILAMSVHSVILLNAVWLTCG